MYVCKNILKHDESKLLVLNKTVTVDNVRACKVDTLLLKI